MTRVQGGALYACIFPALMACVEGDIEEGPRALHRRLRRHALWHTGPVNLPGPQRRVT
jgi:hypothetical protein